jgi:hypothetical protein
LSKTKNVARVEELVNEADVNKALEITETHRIWKKTLVQFRENRDIIWNQFSDLTKQMHDKRRVYLKN